MINGSLLETELCKAETATEEFRIALRYGLSNPQKSVPCKFLYDARGARLFEDICRLEEYYPTRTEAGILRENIREIARLLGPHCRLVELGSGTSAKTRLLLEHLDRLDAYVPIDISRKQLFRTARALSREYPRLDISPLCADYTRRFSLPSCPGAWRAVVFFPGSTIGNFEPEEAREFLERVAAVCGRDGGLLIGVDLKKEREVLLRAYNDAAGVTAAFNLNLLARANRELGTNFDPEAFSHSAIYNDIAGRIEMRLVSRRAQTVYLDEVQFEFETGESIVTEHCYKYHLSEFQRLAGRAGFSPAAVWTDDRGWFSVQYFEVER